MFQTCQISGHSSWNSFSLQFSIILPLLSWSKITKTQTAERKTQLMLCSLGMFKNSVEDIFLHLLQPEWNASSKQCFPASLDSAYIYPEWKTRGLHFPEKSWPEKFCRGCGNSNSKSIENLSLGHWGKRAEKFKSQQVGGGFCGILSSRHDMAITYINSKQLCLPVQDQHKNKQMEMWAWNAEDPHSYLRSYWQ